RYVHTPFGAIAHRGPAIDPTVEHFNLAIAHALQRGSSQRRSSAIVVADDDHGALVRHQAPHAKFQFTAWDQAGARNMRAVVFASFPYVDTSAGGLGIKHVLQVCRGDRLCHAPLSSLVTSQVRNHYANATELPGDPVAPTSGRGLKDQANS